VTGAKRFGEQFHPKSDRVSSVANFKHDFLRTPAKTANGRMTDTVHETFPRFLAVIDFNNDTGDGATPTVLAVNERRQQHEKKGD